MFSTPRRFSSYGALVTSWAQVTLSVLLIMGCVTDDGCEKTSTCRQVPDPEKNDAMTDAGAEDAGTMVSGDHDPSATASKTAAGSSDVPSRSEEATLAGQASEQDVTDSAWPVASSPAPDASLQVDGGPHLNTIDASTFEVDGGSFSDGGLSEVGQPSATSVDAAPELENTTAQSGSRLKVRRITDGRGATMPLDFWDTELNIGCSFRQAIDGEVRCLPDLSDVDDVLFADAECEQPVYKHRYACDNGLMYDLLDTEMFYRKVERPAILSGSEYYRLNGECTMSLSPPGGEYFEAEPFTVTNFVRGQTTNAPREGDLVARYVEGEDGSRLLLETRHATRGYVCAFEESGGFCVPEHDAIRVTAKYFEDDECTQPVYGIPDSLGTPPLLMVPTGSACTLEYDYYERGSLFTGIVEHRLDDEGDCVEAIPPSDYNFFRPGQERLVSEFPHASVQHSGNGDLLARRWVDANDDPLHEVHAFWDSRLDTECFPVQGPDDSVYCLSTNFASIDGSSFSSATCEPGTEVARVSCPPSKPLVAAQLSTRNCDLPIWRASAFHSTGAEFGPDYYFENDYVECEARRVGHGVYYSLGLDTTVTIPSLTLAVVEPAPAGHGSGL